MAIESRMIVGAAGAFALVGAVLWGSALVLTPTNDTARGSVEVTQMAERSWAVEVKDLGAIDKAPEVTRTATTR